jgi:hypothetical protein
MATKETKAVPATQGNTLPATIDLQGDANIGRENMSAKDMAIPYISILQSLSPQVKKGADRIQDAEEGDFFNTVSQEVWGGEQGIYVVPCAFDSALVEWAPRDSGGGFQGSHKDMAILNTTSRNSLGQDVLPNGNILVLTIYHFCLIIDEKENVLEQVVIPFSSTQLKKSRKWNSVSSSIQIQGANGTFNPPLFSHKYHVASKQESNNKGEWYGFSITNAGQISNGNTYNMAKKFAIDVSKGLVKMAEPPADDEPGNDTTY